MPVNADDKTQIKHIKTDKKEEGKDKIETRVGQDKEEEQRQQQNCILSEVKEVPNDSDKHDIVSQAVQTVCPPNQRESNESNNMFSEVVPRMFNYIWESSTFNWILPWTARDNKTSSLQEKEANNDTRGTTCFIENQTGERFAQIV